MSSFYQVEKLKKIQGASDLLIVQDVSNLFIDENCSEVYVLTISRSEHLSGHLFQFVQKLCHVPFIFILKTKSSSVSGFPLLLFLIASVFSVFHSCSSK